MDHGFTIKTQHFQWGTTLAEVAAALPGGTRRTAQQAGWPELAYSGPQPAYGLSAVRAEVRAPARGRPIMQVTYRLAAPPNSPGPADPAIWLDTLERVLGVPSQRKAYPNSVRHGSSGVVFAADWQLGPATLGLSVYGGPRQEFGTTTAAGLYMSWQDEIAAARPFMAAVQAQTAALTTVADGATFWHVARVGEPQRPYRAGFGAAPDELLRQSERALYRPGLCETPAAIRARLPSDHLVGLWAVPESGGQWALSTQYDTVLFVPAQTTAELHTMRPAKGGGAMLLNLGDLGLTDAYDSPILEQLAASLEQSGVTVSRTQSYDC